MTGGNKSWRSGRPTTAGTLEHCTLFATRTTGRTLVTTLGVPVRSLLSGPLGGDAQLGSLLEGRIDGAHPAAA